MSSVNKDSFTSSFSICIPLISFSYLIALAKTFSTMLRSSCGKGHTHIIPSVGTILESELSVECRHDVRM